MIQYNPTHFLIKGESFFSAVLQWRAGSQMLYIRSKMTAMSAYQGTEGRECVPDPPGYSLQAQQRKLNRFVKEYNELRPHEALGMKPPASVHEISDRKYPETVVEWKYPKDVVEKYVSRNGAVRAGRNNWLFITTALAGKNIGFEEIGNRIYRIYFREFFLGYADMKDRKVYDIMTYKNELKL